MSKKLSRKSRYWVYIVRCRDGTYYTGYTDNLIRRINEHNRGYGAKYLKRGKLPVELVFSKEYRYYKNALKAERRIKKLTRKQKENLIKIYAENDAGNRE